MPRRIPPRVYWSEQQVPLPILQTSFTESYIQHPRTAGHYIVERHVQRQPEVIRHQEIEHIYVQEPVRYVETRTYVHDGSSTVDQRDEQTKRSSRTVKHGSKYPNDSKKSSKRERAKTKRRERGDNRKTDYQQPQDSQKERRNQRNRSRSRPRARRRSPSPSESSRESSPDLRSSRKQEGRQSTDKYSKKKANRKSRSYSDDESSRGTHSERKAAQSADKIPKKTANTAEDLPNPQEEASEPITTSSFDPYEALGLQDERDSVDQIEIEATYKALSRKWHPDRHMRGSKEEQDKATNRMAEINRAYDIVGDPKRRAVYDKTGKTEIWELDELVKYVERYARGAQAGAREEPEDQVSESGFKNSKKKYPTKR